MTYPLRRPTVITGPTIEPITLQEAKDQCNIDVDDSNQNALIESYIAAARFYLEEHTGRTFHEQTLQWVLNQWPSWSDAIELPRATPLIVISWIKYKDKDGVETTWPTTEYIADTDSIPGRVVLGYGKSYPSFTPYPVSPIRIQYRAGIATASPLTEAGDEIKIATRLFVAAMFENREAVIVGDRASIDQVVVKYGLEHWLATLREDAPIR